MMSRIRGSLLVGSLLVSALAQAQEAPPAPESYPPEAQPPVYPPQAQPQPAYPPPAPYPPAYGAPAPVYPRVYPPAPAPTPPPAVSEINGYPVKVGERNEYFYAFRRWNVSTNPLGWVFGFYGASLSYGFSPNFAIRGDVNYYAPVDSDTTGFELGVGLPLYLRRTYQGPFLEPGLMVRTMTSKGGEWSTGDHTTTEIGPQVLIGWHWTWDSGFNVAVALGAGRNFSSDNKCSDYCGSEDPLFVNGYLRFGYAF